MSVDRDTAAVVTSSREVPGRDKSLRGALRGKLSLGKLRNCGKGLELRMFGEKFFYIQEKVIVSDVGREHQRLRENLTEYI
ncbi:Uncharacterized protein TCM_009972 [Theobroma cacao]|uniref:Uncharacterized protein n=1 Tax=Theobroma cacao TaxID=3641 RepID=A0A061E5D9_THECC|nr:Uncharacterized protein TCM_009972 [Theobroma cacao]